MFVGSKIIVLFRNSDSWFQLIPSLSVSGSSLLCHVIFVFRQPSTVSTVKNVRMADFYRMFPLCCCAVANVSFIDITLATLANVCSVRLCSHWQQGEMKCYI